MAKRMTIQEKIENRRRRDRNRMIGTAARKLWQEDLRRTHRVTDYEYSTDSTLAGYVDELLADKTVRHIDIPAKAFRLYCAD